MSQFPFQNTGSKSENLFREDWGQSSLFQSSCPSSNAGQLMWVASKLRQPGILGGLEGATLDREGNLQMEPQSQQRRKKENGHQR